MPIIAKSIFSDLIDVHPCTCNLMHGVWSLGVSQTTKAAGSEEISQYGILQGLELVC